MPPTTASCVPGGALPCEHPPGFGISHIDILVEGHRISFSPEPPGWQVVFEDEVSEAWAELVAQAICENMARVSGQSGEVIAM